MEEQLERLQTYAATLDAENLDRLLEEVKIRVDAISRAKQAEKKESQK